MQEAFELNAEPRSDMGKGASRRLRRTGKVPGIIYGGGADPQMISVVHSDLLRHLDLEAFYSSVLKINVGGKAENAVLKDLQRHPAKPFILHFDLQRVRMDEEIRMTVPVHFLNDESCVGVKEGGTLLKSMTELEIICLPSALPEFIAIDVAGLGLHDLIHLSEVELPEGVHLASLPTEENDPTVVAVEYVRVEVEAEEPEEGEEPAAAKGEGEGEGEAQEE